MIRFLLPIFLLLAGFPLAAQGCYENLQNGAGVSADPSRASTIACKLRESLPEANRASFATYSASLYRFAGNFAPGAAEALVTRLEARAAAASPYYLLIVWESSGDNLFATPHVRVNLPADGPFTCLNPLRRSAWQARLLLQAQDDAPKAKDPEDYLRAETKLMEELSGYVKDLIKCCQEGQTCPDCITRKERIALLKAYPFRNIGETSYNPATLKYRVDNVEIPGNSTAQIRDGIGIPLDLGGGPIDIAETLKQLALEKPELGLNALIVHDSLLCDPELLPGRFFGGSGLRSAGSQVYVILQRDGKVDVLGDATIADQINEVLSFGLSLGLSEAEITVGDEVKPTDPCVVDTNPGSIYYTPSGKLIKFKAPIAPKYSSGRGAFPIGSLTAFTVGGKEYWGIYSERKTSSGKERKFMGYLLSDSVRTWRDPTTFRIPSKVMTNSQRINNNKYGKNDEIETNVSNAYLKMSWLDNGVGFSYELNNANDKGPLDGAPLSGDVLLPENLGGVNGCKPCQEGPGAEFYAQYVKEFEGKPTQLLNLCRIASIYNVLGKDVIDALTREHWSEKGMSKVYGNYAENYVLYPELYLKGLKDFADWYGKTKTAFDAFVKLSAATKLYASLSNAGNIYAEAIPVKERIEILKVLLNKDLSFEGLWDRDYRKEIVLNILKTTKKDEDKKFLMEFLKKPETLDLLFSRLAFGNLFGNEKFKELMEILIDLWEVWIKSKSETEKYNLVYPKLIILGTISYAGLDCHAEINNTGDAFIANGKIQVEIKPSFVEHKERTNSAGDYLGSFPFCTHPNGYPVNWQAEGIVRVYFLTPLHGIGEAHTEKFMPAFILPYFAKVEYNSDIKELLNEAVSIIEFASYLSGLGELAALSKLGKLSRIVKILEVVSSTDTYAKTIASPILKTAYGTDTAAYKKLIKSWDKLSNGLAVGQAVFEAAEILGNISNFWDGFVTINEETAANEVKSLKLYAKNLMRAAGLAPLEDIPNDYLKQKLKKVGMPDADASSHANDIAKAVKNRLEAKGLIEPPDLPDKFFELYKNIPSLQAKFRTMLSTWDNIKLKKFFRDLERNGATEFFNSKGDEALKAWELFYATYPKATEFCFS